MIAHYVVFLFKMFLTSILASLIGLNRGKKGVPVGQRTHVIVALIALLVQNASNFGTDTMRLSGQFLTGIGFLCSGVIFKSPDATKVRGLTTSAVVFFCGILGIVIGLGMYFEAITTTLVVLFFLYDPFKIDKNFNNKSKKRRKKRND